MAKVGQLVLNVRRDRLEVDTTNDVVINQFLQMLDQHLLAHIGHKSAELTGAFGPAGQMIEDKGFPFAKDFKSRFQTTSEIRLAHRDLQNSDTYEIVGTGLQVCLVLRELGDDVDGHRPYPFRRKPADSAANIGEQT